MVKFKLFLLIILFCTGCATNGSSTKTDFLLHTTCTITVYEKRQESVIEDAFQFARDLENQLSRTVGTSEISTLSQDNSVMLSPAVLDCLSQAVNLCEKTDGNLDITMGALSDLWNFGTGGTVPSDLEIQTALDHVSYKNLTLSDRTATLLESQSVVDLGAVAKGYIVDMVTQYLKDHGVTSGLVNFGGTVSAIGDKDGKGFSIGLQKPFADQGKSQLVGVVSLADSTMVTAGTYQQCFTLNGQFYHHILDPNSGYPAETDLASVTIFADDATTGDGLSTACVVMGYQKARDFLEEIGGIDAIFILNTGEIATLGDVILEQPPQ